MPTDHRSDWPQFSLKRLLFATVFVAVGLGGYCYFDAYGLAPSPAMMTLIWMACGAAIGTGILLPFRWWRAGAILGAAAGFGAFVYYVAPGI